MNWINRISSLLALCLLLALICEVAPAGGRSVKRNVQREQTVETDQPIAEWLFSDKNRPAQPIVRIFSDGKVETSADLL